MARRFTPEQKQRIAELYESGLSLINVAKAFHSKSPQLFTSILKEMGIKLRNCSPIEYTPTVEEIYGKITSEIQETWSESDERLRRTGTRKIPPVLPIEVPSPETFHGRTDR